MHQPTADPTGMNDVSPFLIKLRPTSSLSHSQYTLFKLILHGDLTIHNNNPVLTVNREHMTYFLSSSKATKKHDRFNLCVCSIIGYVWGKCYKFI